MSKYKRLPLFVMCWLMSFSLSMAKRITVGTANATYTNISDAINMAASGDTLLLLNDIDLDDALSIAKTITIMSEDGYSIKKARNNGMYNPVGITVNSGHTLNLVNVNLDANKKTSYASSSNVYSFFVSVNQQATLSMDYRSAIINCTNGAVLNVSGTVIGGVVRNNSSTSTEVGVVNMTSGGTLVNMLIHSNNLGAGVPCVKMSGGSLINCTITNNYEILDLIASIHLTNRYAVGTTGTDCKIYNCIIYNNSNYMTGNAPTVKNSCIQGTRVVAGEGNININPQFNADYSLPKLSPCVNKGNTSFVESYTSVDIEGNRRVRESSVDMGCYEFQPEYFKMFDTHYSCGEPFVWIDGNTYTETTTEPRDTVFGGVNCDTIKILDLTVYQPTDFSSLSSTDLTKTECTGNSVTFAYTSSDEDRNQFRWIDENEIVVSNSNTYSPIISNTDKQYRLIVSLESGLCPDTISFTAALNRSLSISNSILTIEKAMSESSCSLSELDLSAYKPIFSYCSAYKSSEFYYQLNEGEWISLSDSPILSNVLNNSEIRWKLSLLLEDDDTIEKETDDVQTVVLNDETSPVWSVNEINFSVPVLDSVTGLASISISEGEIIKNISDNCSSELSLYISEDGVSFSSFDSYTVTLNAYESISNTLYCKAIDNEGNVSDIVSFIFKVEKETELNGVMYAIVRDTVVCMGELPFLWHSNEFTYNGESAVIGESHMTIRVDSSFLTNEEIISSEPIIWRDGKRYDKDTVVYDFHTENIGACDSIYNLIFTLEDVSVDTLRLDTMVCMGSLPLEWRGHEFKFDGEVDTVDANILTIHVDSSFLKNETIVSSEPFIWRDGVTYDKDTVVYNFHMENIGACDSIYNLNFVFEKIIPDTIEIDTTVCVGSMPITWRGHEFNLDGEIDTVENYILYIHVDSSYIKYDTLVACADNRNNYTWIDNVTYKGDKSYDIVYNKPNEGGVCDSIIYMHLVINRGFKKPVEDTVTYTGCGWLNYYTFGYAVNSTHSVYKWYEEGEYVPEWDGKTTLNLQLNGRDNYQYMLITNTPDGHCPDTTIYITNSIHDIETGDLKEMILEAGDSCKASVRVRDYMPDFNDHCSVEFVDTVCYYNVNGKGNVRAERDHYYTFEDGDEVRWTAGILASDGQEYTVTSSSYYQTVSVIDMTAPQSDSLGISNGNRVQSITDSISGVVTFTVPTTDVIDHIFDNCDNKEDITVLYGPDTTALLPLAEKQYVLNVFDQPSKLVYYQLIDTKGNISLDSVIYEVERKEIVGTDSFAIVRDTMICPTDLPFEWHGAIFEEPGDFAIVGAAYLTLSIDSSMFKTETIVTYDSLTWRDGNTYKLSTNKPVYHLSNGEGQCDSIINLNLTIYYTTYTTESITVCENDLPYQWNGFELIGDTTFVLKNIDNHDSVVIVDMKILPIVTESIEASSCVSYTLNGETYTESGVYEQHLTSMVTGCDSILTLNLIIFEPTEGFENINVCKTDLPYQWNGFDMMNDTTIILQNQNGCDSILTLNLNVLNEVEETITYTACSSYTLNGETYTESGVYKQNFTSLVTGCDSILILDLTILQPSAGNESVTVCESSLPYTWNGFEVDSDTTIVLQNMVGCDSIVTLKLNILPSIEEQLEVSSCISYTLNGETYTESGVYNQQFTSQVTGCDSTLVLKLTILPSSENTEIISICSSELPYRWNGFDMMNDTIITLQNAEGCDSILTLKLNVLPILTETIEEKSCVSYSINGETFTETGIYEQHLTSTVSGCDSILVLDLTILQPTEGEETISVCRSELPYQWNGFDVTGDTTIILQNSVGCDSTLSLHLNILSSVSESISATACVSFTLNGETYTESGTYEQFFTSVATGCDSTLVLNLTILSPTEGSETISICKSELPYRWNGFDVMGDTTILLTNEAGCDSIVTLVIDELPSITEVLNKSVCESYTLNGETYMESGTYEQHLTSLVTGCDSVLIINLKVLQASEKTDEVTICSSELPYRWNGFDMKNDTTIVLQNVAGCDSTVYLKLNVLPVVSETISETACVSYTLNGETYTESGVYEQHLTSMLTGCDSTLILHLKINPTTYGEVIYPLCDKEPYLSWNDLNIYDDTIVTITNSAGCDSILTIKINRLPYNATDFTEVACSSYKWKDSVYTRSGVYHRKYESETGCDSFVILNLTIVYPVEGYAEETAVGFYEWNDVLYEKSGIYQQTLTAANGCDSIATLNLTILPMVGVIDSLSYVTCESDLPYHWKDTLLDKKINVFNYKDRYGRDSTFIVKLNIIPTVITKESVDACESYIWRGMIITESGVYSDTLKASNGCDSICQVNVTIHHNISRDVNLTTCRHELPLTWDKYQLMGDTTLSLTSTYGCDSIVNVKLTINEDVIAKVEMLETCDSIIEWNGHTFIESGIYVDTLSTINGCDSIVTLNLVMHPSYRIELSDSAIFGVAYDKYGFNIVPDELGWNNYTLELATANHCDSIIHLSLYVEGRDIYSEITSITGGETIKKNGVEITNRFCSSTEIILNYQVEKGYPDTYVITFDTNASAQGFSTMVGQLTDPMGEIRVPIPARANAGTYNVSLQLRGEGVEGNISTASFIIGLSPEKIDNQWSNVVYCKDDFYKSYEWYKNGDKLDNANEQSYREPTNQGGKYSLEVVLPNGDSSYICGKQIEISYAEFSIWASPSYMDGGRSILNIEGVTEVQLIDATLYIYYPNGVLYYQRGNLEFLNELQLPQGMYVCLVKLTDGNYASCKVVSHGYFRGKSME